MYSHEVHFLLSLLWTTGAWSLECSFRSHEALGRLVLAQVQNLNCASKHKSIMDTGHMVASHGHRHEAYDLRLNSSGTPGRCTNNSFFAGT